MNTLNTIPGDIDSLNLEEINEDLLEFLFLLIEEDLRLKKQNKAPTDK